MIPGSVGAMALWMGIAEGDVKKIVSSIALMGVTWLLFKMCIHEE